jgi:hypothetical protein
MEELTGASVAALLRRFENLDGSFIRRIGIHFEEKRVELLLTAFDTERPAAPEAERWVTLRLGLSRVSEFCFREGVKASGVQLDDHLEVVWLDGGVFVILDPLQARDFNQPEWTLDQVRRSRWYAGGQSLSWDIPSGEIAGAAEPMP